MNIKKSVVLFLIILFVFSFGVYVYANNEKKNNTQVKLMDQVANDFKDSVEKGKKEKIINENEKIKYKKTKSNKDIYISSAKDEYIYMEDKMVGFIKNINPNNLSLSVLDEKVSRKIADKFLKENIVNFQKYEFISCEYIESYAQSSYIYMNKLNKIDTNDIVCINIDNAGNVASYSAFKQGMFEKYKDLKIDMNIIKSTVLEEMKDKYNNDNIKIEINYSFFNIINDELVLQCDITIELENESEKVFDTIIYEL